MIEQSSEEIEIASKANEISSKVGETSNFLAAGALLVALVYLVSAMANHKAERVEDKISHLQQQKLTIQLQSKCKLSIENSHHAHLTVLYYSLKC